MYTEKVIHLLNIETTSPQVDRFSLIDTIGVVAEEMARRDALIKRLSEELYGQREALKQEEQPSSELALVVDNVRQGDGSPPPALDEESNGGV